MIKNRGLPSFTEFFLLVSTRFSTEGVSPMKPATQSRIDLVLPSFPISFDSIFVQRCFSHEASGSEKIYLVLPSFPIFFDSIFDRRCFSHEASDSEQD